MKCLRCEKEATFGNYCQDHAAETGTILARKEEASPEERYVERCEIPRKAWFGNKILLVVAISIIIVLLVYRFIIRG